MADLPDIDLQKTDLTTSTSDGESRSPTPWIVVALVGIAALVAGYYFFFFPRATPQPTFAEAPATDKGSGQPTQRALGGTGDAIELPPLDQSDPLVRRLFGAISSHPRVAAWLATDNLIRNFVVVVTNIAEGRTPAPRLRTLRPAGRFRVTTVGNEQFAAAANYDRYNQIADAVVSIDPAGAVRLYSTLKPRIEDANRELGNTETFDRTLERAIAVLLEVPIIERNIRIEPHEAVYRYEDPVLERLTASQKQLLRMGPRNVRLIQSRLRDVGLALGISADRLPKR